MSAAAVIDFIPELVDESPPRLHDFVESSGLRSVVVGTSKDPNAKITILLVAPNGSAVLAVKAPTTDVAACAVEAERRLLADLHDLQLRNTLESVPRVVGVVDFDGRPALVTTAVQGTPMSTTYRRWRHTASPAQVGADFAAVEAWLVDFQHGTEGRAGPIDMDAGVSARLQDRFDAVDDLETDLDRLAEIHGRLGCNAAPRTAVHGDLWFGNLLTSGRQISGVVDWEAGASTGEPVRDLVRFAVMYALYLDRSTRKGRRAAGHPGLRAGEWGVGVEYALDGTGWFPDLFRRFLGDGLARLGASPLSWRDVAIAGIAEVAALTDEDEFARRHLELFRRLGR